ncbi:MAG TPA: hypothetical protein VIH37_02910 [Candidatus Limnocylindrales bacterium]
MSAAPATSSPERQGAPPSTAAGSAFAAAAALRLASIGGPLTVEEVRHGTYAELWDGSTNDLSGVGTASRASRAPLTVWRVLVAGPNGSEELFIVDPGGVLIDTITQGQ